MLGHCHQPIRHRAVETAWRVDRNDRVDAWRLGDLLKRQSTRNRHHGDAVERPAPADRRDVERLVGQRQVGEIGVEVPGIGRKLDRRAYLVAEHGDAVEMLRQPHQVVVVAQVAGAAPTLHVVHIRRAGHQREVDRVATEMHRPLGVPRLQRERRRDGFQSICDKAAIDTHCLRGMIHRRACPFEQRQRARAHHLDAEIFEDVHRGRMDRFDLIRRQQLHRWIWISHRADRQLRNGGAGSRMDTVGAASGSKCGHAASDAQRALAAVRNPPLLGVILASAASVARCEGDNDSGFQ